MKDQTADTVIQEDPFTAADSADSVPVTSDTSVPSSTIADPAAATTVDACPAASGDGAHPAGIADPAAAAMVDACIVACGNGAHPAGATVAATPAADSSACGERASQAAEASTDPCTLAHPAGATVAAAPRPTLWPVEKELLRWLKPRPGSAGRCLWTPPLGTPGGPE